MEEKVIFAPKTVKIKGGEILIRLLREEDGSQLVLEEQAQGWGTTTEKFETRLRDFADGKCIPLCAELDGKPVGYVNLYTEPSGPFSGTNWPYIVDFAVLECVRGRGVGSALMDAVEALAAEASGHRVPRRRLAQRLRCGAAHVRAARVRAGWFRRVVRRTRVRAIRAVRER